jgi:branched-subunit amino acid aminotransferase/4-amino-4-deoxychorismate lyase
MDWKYFSKNGELLPIAEATIPLSSIEYTYGFGVYESIRVTKGTVYFIDDHVERLMESAQAIDLEHPFDAEFVKKNILELVAKNEAETCNIKILLIGGTTAEKANLFILCLNPFFPDRKFYKEGAAVTTAHFERVFPHAKTLNMLQSYLAYRKAKRAGAYDALLINRNGLIIEGTRTNFFCITGKTLYTPNEDEILLGVTRKAILQVAKDKGYTLEQKNIPLQEISQYEGAFVTSTSSKIVPINAIDDEVLPPIPQVLKELMHAFDEFLDSCNGKLD